MVQFTVKELKEALEGIPDDTDVWGHIDGNIILERFNWTEQKTVKELIEASK